MSYFEKHTFRDGYHTILIDAGTILRIHRWVAWWFGLGVIFGAVALANIFFRDLTRTQDRVILFLGVLHWLLGGLACWGWEGAKFERQQQEAAAESSADPLIPSELNLTATTGDYGDPNVTASRALRFIRPRGQELLAYYFLRHWENKTRSHGH